MLTPENKKAIDNCRQILVGKIPSPEGQIEQVTMAMLYKFMDDMDTEAIALGGKPQFFTGDYEKYSWRKIMAKTFSAQDRYNLYTEALEKFYVHPTMNAMFREIFKNANVPFKEADFLTMFLREIDNGFDYSDSETLGDAYEYLLADQASQKGLGQFRTPRHIIDFIIDVVSPQKSDKILDPACGTAGFLISAYKYILKENTEKRLGDKLNYDEKKELLEHLTGYDIEPKMIKIARMNMFLHGASNPDIMEYDTLSMDDNWDEKYNVIVANPPFMTPKGGIKPHKKFRVSSSKSEVLFVDYIESHLRINGRAGFVVPDGIVSNNGKQSKSYVELRKILTENKHVFAVVSLHPYVFKPYADVKTSIIFMDKAIQTDKVLFVTVDDDGFEKGERRREIKLNDLPEAKKIINEFYNKVKKGEPIEEENIESDVQNVIVDLDTIKDNSYILRGERYLIGKNIEEDTDSIKFSDLIEEVKNKATNEDDVYSISNVRGFVKSDEYFNDYFEVEDKSNYWQVEKDCFAFNPARINVGSIALYDNDKVGCISPMYKIFKIKDEYRQDIQPRYLLSILKSKYAKDYINRKRTGVRGSVDLNGLADLQIPIPNISEQKIISSKQDMNSSLSTSIEKINYTVTESDKWDIVPITELFEFEKGNQQISKNKDGEYSLVTTASIVPSDHYDYDSEAICVPTISSKGHGVAELKRIFYANGKFCCGDILMVMLPKNEKKVNVKFYYYYLSTYLDKYFTRLMTGTTNVGFTIDDAKTISIPYPDIDEQNRIVAEAEKYEKAIESLNEIIEENNKTIDKLIDLYIEK